MSYRTWIEIDSQALRHNLKVLRGLLKPETKFLVVVKANAYGHGLKEISELAWAEGVTSFGVDSVDDALFLRQKFPTAQIIILGYILKEDLPKVIAADIEFVVYNQEIIEAIEKISSDKKALVHLKIETGTSRQGILLNDLQKFIDLINQSAKIKVVGISSHFSTAEENGENTFFVQQLEILKQAEQKILAAGFSPEYVHCACSAAILSRPESHWTLVRSGLITYGCWPSEEIKKMVGEKIQLKPVLSWKTRIAQIKDLSAGTPIGYGRTEILKKSSRVAVLPVGYFDGYDRKLSSIGEVLVKGQRCRVIGLVCMNMMMIDVTEVSEIKIEDEVILIGDEITVDELATKIKTISYEVLARIRSDLPKIIV